MGLSLADMREAILESLEMCSKGGRVVPIYKDFKEMAAELQRQQIAAQQRMAREQRATSGQGGGSGYYGGDLGYVVGGGGGGSTNWGNPLGSPIGGAGGFGGTPDAVGFGGFDAQSKAEAEAFFDKPPSGPLPLDLPETYVDYSTDSVVFLGKRIPRSLLENLPPGTLGAKLAQLIKKVEDENKKPESQDHALARFAGLIFEDKD